MTTLTTPRTAATAVEPRARFRDLLAAEWIKLWSLRSTSLVLGLGALVIIGINANSARSNVNMIASRPAGFHNPLFDPMNSAFVTNAYQILMIIAASVGAITVFGEYTSGLVRTTFAAVPARRPVVAAKVAVVTAVMFVLGAVVSATSFGVTQAILHTQHLGLSISAPGALRAVVASALLAPVCALVGMGIGALIRHATGTIVATIGVLLLLPSLFQGETYRWVKEIGNAMPYAAWDALVQNPAAMQLNPSKYPVSITEAWIVFGAWSLAAAMVAVTAVHRRDL
jgi:hypothetical protein